jgi:hypothetical protein
MRKIILILGLLCGFNVYSSVSSFTANDYQEVANIVKTNEIKNAPSTLVVFDIDDTLLTSSQELGGVGWFDWQASLLKNNPKSNYLFANNIMDLLKIQNLLFHMVDAKLTDEFVLKFINGIAKKSKLLVLTARNPFYENVTTKQFKKVGYISQADENIFQTYGISFHGYRSNVIAPFVCTDLKRRAVFSHGVFYASGQNKGMALKCILGKSEQTFKNIIFIDDSYKNVEDVANAFEVSDVNVFAIHYTHENSKEEKIKTSPMLQTKIFMQWQLIKNSIHTAVANSDI